MQWLILSTEIDTIAALRFEGCHANFSDGVINTFMVISFGLSHYLSTWQKKGGFCMCWGGEGWDRRVSVHAYMWRSEADTESLYHSF